MEEDDINKKLGSERVLELEAKLLEPDPVTLLKEKLLTKLMVRIDKQKQFQGKLDQLKENFRKLCHCSKSFRNTFLDFPPGKYSLEQLINENIDWVKMNKKLKQNFGPFAAVVKELYRDYGIDIFITKSKDGGIGFSYYLRNRIHDVYEVNGKNIKYTDFNKPATKKTYKELKIYEGLNTDDMKKIEARLLDDEFSKKRKEGFEDDFKKLTSLKGLLDEIEIEDKTNEKDKKNRSNLIVGLALTSRSFPTVLKYVHCKGTKKLFVSFPEYIDPSTFFRGYGKIITKIHSDFFKRTYKGRPEEKNHQLELIKEIWKEKCKDKRLSNNQQSKILSDELMKRHDINLEPISITRWYLPLIKGKNATKNS